MTWALLDSSVYIDLWERGRHVDALRHIGNRLVIRISSVVLSELRRGARSKAAIRLVEDLRRSSSVVWVPDPADWWRAGVLIQELGEEWAWDTRRRRDFQNDALIGLTARRYGATVVTTNARDFQLLHRAIGVSVLPL